MCTVPHRSPCDETDVQLRVNPTYFVTFTTSVIIASTILFQGFNTANTTTTLTLLAGFVVTFLGVHLLNISRIPDPPPLTTDHESLASAALDTGVMVPRMSISGSLSHEAWAPSNGIAFHGGHSRRSSINRGPHAPPRSHSLAFSEEDGAVRMERLREHYEDDDADERTRLTGNTDEPLRPRSPPRSSHRERPPRIDGQL